MQRSANLSAIRTDARDDASRWLRLLTGKERKILCNLDDNPRLGRLSRSAASLCNAIYIHVNHTRATKKFRHGQTAGGVRFCIFQDSLYRMSTHRELPGMIRDTLRCPFAPRNRPTLQVRASETRSLRMQRKRNRERKRNPHMARTEKREKNRASLRWLR